MDERWAVAQGVATEAEAETEVAIAEDYSEGVDIEVVREVYPS